jgi:hypothetical protein
VVVKEQFDDGIWLMHVSAIIGIGLRSGTIMVIDLSRGRLMNKDCGCVAISPNLCMYIHSTLYGQGIG